MLVDPCDPRLLWLVLRTKPKQERTVADVLRGREVPAYCPRVLEPRAHPRAPHGPVPLFPSYVFAHCVAKERLAAVNYCPGSLGVVRFGELVAAVEDEFIAALYQRAGERGYLVFGDVHRRLPRGTRVRIVSGCLAGLEGIVERYTSGRERVRLLLQLVSGTRMGEVGAGDVRALN